MAVVRSFDAVRGNFSAAWGRGVPFIRLTSKMTLIVAMANDSVAVLVADRRVTQGQIVLDDEFNKVTVLVCKDARLSLAFTGLATYNNFNTSEWIANTLHEICEKTAEIHSILVALEARAGETFSALAAENRRLTIVLCGFVYLGGAPEPRIYIMSNFEHGAYSPGVFSTRSVGALHQTLVETAGQSSSLPAPTVETLHRLLVATPPAAALVRYTVRHLQNAAKHAKALNRIGERCTGAIVQSAIDTSITTTYHTPRNANRAYGPNIVIAQSMTSLGSEIMAGSILAGPDIRKQDICWCGSGKQFKHCHMRKYGGVYMRHPAWKRPLVPFFRVQREDAWPSGRVFTVQGGYE